MDGKPLAMLKRSLENGGNYIRPTTKVGLVTYDSNVYINLPISEFSLTNRAYFNGAVQAMQAGSSTATYDGVLVAITMIEEELAVNPNAKAMIFVLSDGAQNVGHTFGELEQILRTFKIPVHTIGYSTDADTKKALEALSNVNEAAFVEATPENVSVVLKNFFSAEM